MPCRAGAVVPSVGSITRGVVVRREGVVSDAARQSISVEIVLVEHVYGSTIIRGGIKRLIA